MKSRNSDRDIMKLAQWEEYVRKTDYSVPQTLESSAAVDKLFVFDNENNETATASLEKLLEILGGKENKGAGNGIYSRCIYSNRCR
jgi:hypothetical protein